MDDYSLKLEAPWDEVKEMLEEINVNLTDEDLRYEKGKEKDLQAGPVPTEPRGSHVANWLECIRSRQRPNADIQFGHQHAVATIMTAKALETGMRQTYDPVRRVIAAG